VRDLLREEMEAWIACHPNAGWFDWWILAESVVSAAFDEDERR
jgi:hypothetical protein